MNDTDSPGYIMDMYLEKDGRFYGSVSLALPNRIGSVVFHPSGIFRLGCRIKDLSEYLPKTKQLPS